MSLSDPEKCHVNQHGHRISFWTSRKMELQFADDTNVDIIKAEDDTFNERIAIDFFSE